MDDTYNPERLNELGRRRLELRAQLDAVSAELDAEILTAAGRGLLQAEIVRRTDLTRESVAQKMRPKEQRWKRGTHN